jgi:hypothetical protein
MIMTEGCVDNLTWEQFDPSMVSGRKVAGASTPDYIINEGVQKLHAL